MSFARPTQDGDDEGILLLDRLPTEAEASVIRDYLGIAKRPGVSEPERERRRWFGERLRKNPPSGAEPLQEPRSATDLHVGLGLTTRHNAEFCLLARRGRPKRLDKGVREIILAPVKAHSRKPAEIYSRIERFCPGPRLELFARERRPGWASWGDEVGKFQPPKSQRSRRGYGTAAP